MRDGRGVGAAILPVLRWPDARLAAMCRAVGPGDDVAGLAADMLATLYHVAGRGLAAPQVGALLRLFVMDSGWKQGAPDPKVFVNPAVVAVSDGMATLAEGCLSIPGISADVTRPVQVELRWHGLDGTEQQQWFTGFDATCIQHEVDHLDGIVTLDRVDAAARARLLRDYAP